MHAKLIHKGKCRLDVGSVLDIRIIFNERVSCSSVLTGGDKGNLSVVATVFDKLNQVYKEYLDAEQAYTAVSTDIL